jgi:hypothetical protein
VRLWLGLSGLALIAVIVAIISDHVGRAAAPCIAQKYFERIAITMPREVSSSLPKGHKLLFPSDAKELEVRELLLDALRLDDPTLVAAMRSWSIVQNDDHVIGPPELSGCSRGFLMPKVELRTQEPYASAIRNTVFTGTKSLSLRLGGSWLVANAVIVGFFLLALWIARGFAEGRAGKSQNVTNARVENAETPALQPAETKGRVPSGGTPIGTRRKIVYWLEFLLHGFAMALGVPIASAAGFDGAIPVMMVVLVIACGSVCVVWAVRKSLASGPLRTAVLVMLPIVYFGAYLAAYTAIRS